MPRDIEEPKVEQINDHITDSVTTHPAYGQIGAYRVSGRTALYGSDFMHDGYITIKIVRSELHRHLSNDNYYGKDDLIEVSLSNAQWCNFVSSMNMGSGVPVTITRLNRKSIPALPDPPIVHEQYTKEMKKKTESCVSELQTLYDQLDAMGLPKGKTNEIKSRLNSAMCKVSSHIPFIATQFEEHMEESVEKAKVEVHSYINATIAHAGLQAISGKEAPLQLEIANGN